MLAPDIEGRRNEVYLVNRSDAASADRGSRQEVALMAKIEAKLAELGYTLPPPPPPVISSAYPGAKCPFTVTWSGNSRG